MPDREKVISDLQEQIDWIRDNEFHKFPGWGHTVLAMKDALALLKEMEAVEPFHKCIGNEFSLIEDRYYDYCPYCGKPIAWEGR